MKTLKFKFDIGERVSVCEINRPATVVGYYYSETGIQYQVAYFNDGDRLTVYLYESELIGIRKEETGLAKNV